MSKAQPMRAKTTTPMIEIHVMQDDWNSVLFALENYKHCMPKETRIRFENSELCFPADKEVVDLLVWCFDKSKQKASLNRNDSEYKRAWAIQRRVEDEFLKFKDNNR